MYDDFFKVRILRTAPALYGTIQSFYLYGEYEGDIYAMGGDIELQQVNGVFFFCLSCKKLNII